MRISPINTSYSSHNYQTRKTYLRNVTSELQPTLHPTFKRHEAKKILTPLFGVTGAIAAVGGTALMGGVWVPAVLAYGALSALTGLLIGRELDKKDNEDEELLLTPDDKRRKEKVVVTKIFKGFIRNKEEK